MKVILFSRLCHKSGSVAFSLPKVTLCVTGLMLLVITAALWTGYQLGRESSPQMVEQSRINLALKKLLAGQRAELQSTKLQTRANLDAMALQMGEMQSRLLRLDALGEQLAALGELDQSEFDFSEAPALGGLEEPATARSVKFSELLVDMDRLSQRIEDRERKLRLLEGMILGGKIEAELIPAGRPVKKGWISSPYGNRTDPFSGKKAFHRGVDIAGKKGTEVFAVAAGVVTEAGPRTGYGYLVEITHAEGLVTRYAHNSKLMVAVGDLVSKGQVIGAMGSTGRSTGPHVHFEIARNGKSINPAKYLRRK